MRRRVSLCSSEELSDFGSKEKVVGEKVDDDEGLRRWGGREEQCKEEGSKRTANRIRSPPNR